MAHVIRAGAADIPRILDMAERLVAHIGTPVPVDREWMGRNVARLIAGADSAVWVSPAGFLAGSVQPTILHPGLVGMEHGWWAEDGRGLALLRRFEAWARQRGAGVVQLSTGPTGPDMSRLGYRLAEQSWTRSWPSSPSSPPPPSGVG